MSQPTDLNQISAHIEQLEKQKSHFTNQAAHYRQLQKKMRWRRLLRILPALPLLIFFTILFCLGYTTAIITKKNTLALKLFKIGSKAYCLLNGIHLKTDNRLKNLENALLITNHTNPIDFMLLSLILPLNHVIVLPEHYFKPGEQKISFYQKILFMLNFLPPENFTIFNFTKKSFTLENFLKHGYSAAQTIDTTSLPTQKTPFLVMLAIKHQRPIHIVEIKGSQETVLASIFTPRTVHITLKTVFEPGTDLKETIAKFNASMKFTGN